MLSVLYRLKARLGEFWFYSLMLFCAQRAADALNVFVGLWLVPKYVGTSELGAVMPLMTFAGFLALPAGVFATVFMKELVSLASRGEYGKMKSLMRGVFVVAAASLVVAIVSARLLMPLFLERMRIVEGSLGFVILAAAFVGCVAPVYTNALQALKRFTAMSVIGFLGAPVRLLTMLVAMPFRALTGYFVGQASVPAFSMIAAVFCLRKELSVKAEPYWNRRVLSRFVFLLVGVGLTMVSSNVYSLIEQTVIRQRMPDVDSAAYYMASRFSDIANFIATALMATLFPYTAELSEKGKSTRPLVMKTSFVTLAFGLALALLFGFFGKSALSVLPNGDVYRDYSWAIPWLIVNTTLFAVCNIHVNTEISAGRFRFLKWWGPVNVGFAVLLLCTTGYGYFVEVLPDVACEFLADHNVTDLRSMLWWMSAYNAVKTVCAATDLSRQMS